MNPMTDGRWNADPNKTRWEDLAAKLTEVEMAIEGAMYAQLDDIQSKQDLLSSTHPGPMRSLHLQTAQDATSALGELIEGLKKLYSD